MKTLKQFAAIVLFIVSLSIIASCGGCIKGDGNVKTEERLNTIQSDNDSTLIDSIPVEDNRVVSTFNSIHLSGAINVFIDQGNGEKVVVQADQNLLPHIITEVVNKQLKIYTKKNISNAKSLNVFVTVKEIKGIYSSGACDIETKKLICDNFRLEISGAADAVINIETKDLICELSGAGNITFAGKTDNFTVEMSGAADIEAFDLESNKCKIEVSGAGNANINTKELEADVSGAANVYYKGEPKITKLDVSGAASVEKK